MGVQVREGSCALASRQGQRSGSRSAHPMRAPGHAHGRPAGLHWPHACAGDQHACIRGRASSMHACMPSAHALTLTHSTPVAHCATPGMRLASQVLQGAATARHGLIRRCCAWPTAQKNVHAMSACTTVPRAHAPPCSIHRKTVHGPFRPRKPVFASARCRLAVAFSFAQLHMPRHALTLHA